MRLLKELFDNNQRWAQGALAHEPEFFHRLASQQAPDFLWIGCSDSRVPANVITGLLPGEVFVHRNIANIVRREDPNCHAVMQYAIEVLQVKHVLVVGHYGCGGVAAAIEHNAPGQVAEWLAPLRELYIRYRPKLDALADGDRRNRLCELNVIAQAQSVCESPSVRAAWSKHQELAVHGWIYGIENGLLKDLDVTVTGPDESDQIFRAAFA